MLLTKICTSGKLITVWITNDNNINVVKETSSVSIGSAWNIPTIISNSSASVMAPVIAGNNNDDVVIMWSSFSITNGVQNYFACICPSATGIWSSPVELSNIGSVHNDAKISLTDTGNILALWSAYTTPDEIAIGIYTSTSTISTNVWTTPVNIN